MFSIPLTVSVTSSSGSTQTQGIPGNRQGILNAIAGLGSPWSALTTTRSSDGLPIRVLAPVHAIANGSFSSTYLDAYVSAVWSYYASHTLTVADVAGQLHRHDVGQQLDVPRRVRRHHRHVDQAVDQ